MNKSAINTWSAIGILTGIGLIGLGLGLQIKRQIDLLNAFCWKIKPKSFKAQTLTQKGFSFSLILLVRNLSNINASLNGYNFDIFINGIHASSIVSNEKQEFKADSLNEIKLNVLIDFSKDWTLKKVLELVGFYLSDKTKIVIQTKGHLSAKHSFFKVSNIPIDFTYNLAELLAPSEEQTNCQI